MHLKITRMKTGTFSPSTDEGLASDVPALGFDDGRREPAHEETAAPNMATEPRGQVTWAGFMYRALAESPCRALGRK